MNNCDGSKMTRYERVSTLADIGIIWVAVLAGIALSSVMAYVLGVYPWTHSEMVVGFVPWKGVIGSAIAIVLGASALAILLRAVRDTRDRGSWCGASCSHRRSDCTALCPN